VKKREQEEVLCAIREELWHAGKGGPRGRLRFGGGEGKRGATALLLGDVYGHILSQGKKTLFLPHQPVNLKDFQENHDKTDGESKRHICARLQGSSFGSCRKGRGVSISGEMC